MRNFLTDAVRQKEHREGALLFIQMMANSVPALYFKKFVGDNNIVGRKITLDAMLQNLDESPLENYQYMAMTG